MKKYLRLLAWLLSLTMLCELLPFAAFAQSDVGEAAVSTFSAFLEQTNGTAVETGKCGDNLTYSLDDAGTLTISGSGEMTSAPWREGHTDNNGYEYRIHSIVFPDGLSNIFRSSFRGSVNVTSVTIPGSVKTIGNSAFWECPSLTEVTIQDGVTEICDSAFSRCRKLTTVYIPNSVSSIGVGVFADDDCLSSIVLPSALTSISVGTFAECVSLANITIPASVTSIGSDAFRTCNSLTDVYYLGTQSQWDAINGKEQLSSATIHVQPNKFTFGRDNLSFLNNNNYFTRPVGKDDVWNSFLSLVDIFTHKYTYQLSDEKYSQLTAGFSARTKSFINKKRQERWTGSCYGMSVVTMLHYLDPSRIPLSSINSSAVNLFDLNYPKDDSSVMDFVNYYYLTQYFPTLINYRSDCYARYKNDLSGEINLIISALQKGLPVLACTYNHAFLLIGIDSENDDSYTIRVDDPNCAEVQHLTLYKNDSVEDTDLHIRFPKIYYNNGTSKYYYLRLHILPQDIDFADLRNYFGKSDNEHKSDYDSSHVIIKKNGDYTVKCGQAYVRMKDGSLEELKGDVQVCYYFNGDEDSVDIMFPKTSSAFEFTVNPDDNATSNSDILLNDTLLSITSDGAFTAKYDEQIRDISITTNTQTDVNVLMTQNETTESFPWHSWAVDTTDTTTLQIKLDDDGLHMTGDGLANAEYAIKNEDTDKLVNGAITNSPDAVTGLISTTIHPSASDGKDPTPTPNPTPSTPTTPTTTSSSGGGGGGGAALILGAGAVALTAGLVLTAPVAVQGNVEFSDHTAVPGAKIALLQNGNVVAQTTADENGAFFLKVKRGNYELTAAYTDADGQLHHQTLSIKAPAKDLTITF